MTIEQLRNIHQARPFRPFIMKLANGTKLQVALPELLAYSGSGRTVILVRPEDSFEVVDLLLVASIEVNGERIRLQEQPHPDDIP